MKQVTPEISCVECNAKLHSIFHKMQLQELENLDGLKSCGHYKKVNTFYRTRQPAGSVLHQSRQDKTYRYRRKWQRTDSAPVKEGDVIGYRSLISNDRYHCSAVAIEDSSVCFIPRSAFNNLIKENSAVSYEVMKLLSDNLKKQNGKSFLLPKNVRERMAEALLFSKLPMA